MNSSNSLQKLFGRYSRNGTGGIILNISGDNIVSGETFSHYVLDGVLKIIPIQIKRLIDVIIGNCCRFENLKHFLQHFFCGFFAKVFLGEVKNAGYSRCGYITLKKVLFCQAENESRINIPRLAMYKNIKRNIGVDKNFHYNPYFVRANVRTLYIENETQFQYNLYFVRANVRTLYIENETQFQYRCFTNLSLRISSTLISVCNIPVSESKVSSCSNVSIFDLVKCIFPFFSVFFVGIGVKAMITSPAGISRGMSMVICRRLAGIFMVCVMVIH